MIYSQNRSAYSTNGEGEVDEFDYMNTLDSRGRVQIIKLWAQKVADGYRVANGDSYRNGHTVIPLDSEEFPLSIVTHIRYSLEQKDELHKTKIRPTPMLDDWFVTSTLRAMLKKDGSLNTYGIYVIEALLSLLSLWIQKGMVPNFDGNFQVQAKKRHVGKI